MILNMFRGRRKLSGVVLSFVALLSVMALFMPALTVHSNNNIDAAGLGQLRTNGVGGRALQNVDDALPDLDGHIMDIPETLPDVPAVPSLALDRPPVAPYSLANALATVPRFKDTFAVIVYDPPADKFVAHYSDNMRWISSCHKLITSFKILAHSLRSMNPDRFRKDQPEFALTISSADYPGIRWNDCVRAQRSDCFDNGGGDAAVALSPILQFGSSFRRPILPTMIAMPMPQMNHLMCFHQWATWPDRGVCNYYLPRGPGNEHGLVFPETLGVKSWDELFPQVVWRGTDFSYLSKLLPMLRKPDFEADVANQLDLSEKDARTAATRAMRQVYDDLIPRWKGVVLTAEAEREAEAANEGKKRREKPVLPWADIKFANAMYTGKKTPTSEIPYYRQFEEHGIPAVGEGMPLEALGMYRYHVDLGGGGGTTWSGTLEKLGLPGLLFHHLTPTKDYLHDRLVPWVHYVPIREDLSDLHEKFLWAEANPDAARRISDNATELARSFGTPEGFGAMFRDFFEGPLRDIVEAYQPLGPGVDWREEMARLGGEDLRPVLACHGRHLHACERLAEGVSFDRHDRDLNMSA